MATEPRQDVSDSSEDEADVFDNYGVFQSDYEFKFVQEGNDKTTLMLPPVTYDSMEVKYFNIEIEVDSELNVSSLEKEETVNGTTRFFFRIAKQGLQVVQEDEVEELEKLVEDEYEEMKDYAAEKAERAKKRKPKKPRTAMDAHNYSKPKVVMTSAPTVKVEDEVEKDNEIDQAQGEALDGTQLDKETSSFLEQCEDGEEEEIEDEGEDMDDDGDDDMDDFDEIEIGGNLTLPGEEDDDDDGDNEDDLLKTPKRKGKGPKASDKKRRKYDKTNFYSKNSSNFTVEMTDEGAGKMKYSCKFCDYVSISRSAGNIRDHERKHTGERPFVCDVCGESFTRVENLKSHETMHSFHRPFICPKCGACFKSRKRLTAHEQTVHIKKYRCQICGKAFGASSAIGRHMVVHTGERKFECHICHKKFAQETGMKRHMQGHTGGRFQCHLCARRFIRKGYFREHMMKVHDFVGNEDFLIKRGWKVEPSLFQ